MPSGYGEKLKQNLPPLRQPNQLHFKFFCFSMSNKSLTFIASSACSKLCWPMLFSSLNWSSSFLYSFSINQQSVFFIYLRRFTIALALSTNWSSILIISDIFRICTICLSSSVFILAQFCKNSVFNCMFSMFSVSYNQKSYLTQTFIEKLKFRIYFYPCKTGGCAFLEPSQSTANARPEF